PSSAPQSPVPGGVPPEPSSPPEPVSPLEPTSPPVEGASPPSAAPPASLAPPAEFPLPPCVPTEAPPEALPLPPPPVLPLPGAGGSSFDEHARATANPMTNAAILMGSPEDAPHDELRITAALRVDADVDLLHGAGQLE